MPFQTRALSRFATSSRHRRERSNAYVYTTEDSAAAVTAPGYFSGALERFRLRAGDVIDTTTAMLGTPARMLLTVTAIASGVVTVTDGAAAVRLPTNTQVYALGDSRMLDNFRSGAICIEGPMTWTRQASLGRIDFRKVNNNGVGGANTTEIRANQYPTAKASEAKILVLLAGVNDANSGSVTAADTIANLTFMAQDWCASDPGRICLILDELPVSGLNKPAQQLATRDGVRALHAPASGISVVPSWNVAATVADGDTPQSWAYRDGIHCTKRLSRAVGKVIWDTLKALVPSFDVFAQPGVAAGGDFVPNGNAPTGWTVPTGTGISTAMVVENGINWCVVTIDSVASLNAVLYYTGTSFPAGWTAGTTDFDALIRYRIDAGSVNLSRVTMEGRKQGGTQLLAVTGEVGTDGGDRGSTYETSADAGGPIGPEAFDGILRPPVLDIPSDATAVRPWWITLKGISGQTTSAVIRFAMPQARAV